MSDIPRARAMLEKADKVESGPGAEKMLRYIIREALKHLDRERPEFVAPKKRPPLTVEQVMRAKELRAQGLALHEIVRRLGGNTDIGRVSEAINGLRDGV